MDPLNTLQRLGSGHFIDQLEEALLSVSQEVLRTHSPGRVNVTFSIEAEAGDIAVSIKEAIVRRMPKEASLGAYLFVHGDTFHTSDPRQVAMEFRVVNTDTGELRTPTDDSEETREIN